MTEVDAMKNNFSKLIYIFSFIKNFDYKFIDSMSTNNYSIKIFDNPNFNDFENALKVSNPDLIIMIANNYDSDINFLCKSIRTLSTVPFIMLSENISEDNKITALTSYFDDYITMPLSNDEFIAKISALFRRIEFEANKCNLGCSYNYNNLAINLKRHEVVVNSDIIYLTSKEYEVLIYILENKDRVVLRDEILANIWGFDSNLIETRAIDDCIKRLRKKLSDANADLVIETVRGYGFRLKN